jgi:succinyl-diaminopimelate desuccinylase
MTARRMCWPTPWNPSGSARSAIRSREWTISTRGSAGPQPNLCFAGHTDVVPVGDDAGWTVDPVRRGDPRRRCIYGRGTSDMKGAIAAFVSAPPRATSMITARPDGSISLLITGDEEGPGLHGTRRLLPAVIADGETIDHCIVGEPTSEDVIADIVKNGRRGSLNAGDQGRRQARATRPTRRSRRTRCRCCSMRCRSCAP